MRKTLEEICVQKGEYGGGFAAIDYFNRAPRYVRITDINSEGKLNNDRKAPSGEEIEWDKYLLHDGDLLFARSGATVGKTFLYTKEFGKCIFAGYLIRFKLNKDTAFPKYVYYYTKTPEYNAWIKNKQNVVAQPNINAKQYGTELKIPLPPLPTQKKIAAILDEADAYRQLTKDLIEKYDQLAQALFLDMFGDPVTNPKGWEQKTLKSLTSKIGSGATPRGGKESYKTEGISIVRSLNIHDNYFKYKDLAYVDEDQAAKLNNVTLKKNDVLFNITGASVCRCCIVPNKVLPGRVNQHVAIIRPIEMKMNPVFLCFSLISSNTKKKLMGIATQGGATREAITKEQLENFKLPIPPIEQQNQFADRIQLIGQQKQQAQASLQKAEELLNSLLQRAFKGELV